LTWALFSCAGVSRWQLAIEQAARHLFRRGPGRRHFIVSSTGQQVLIDGGLDPVTLLAVLGAQIPFWDRSLDLVILTHPDDDHLMGLVPVVEGCRVGQVFDLGHSSLAPAYACWQR
jgi:competence protein ComEC